MLLRAITLAGGIAGAAGLSQVPEFSQQYVQRLGGAVDELSRFVAAFDADAASVGLSRRAALADLTQGGAMGAQRATTMSGTIERQARLSGELAALTGAGPFTRAYRAARFGDDEIAARAWSTFNPALPLSPVGAVFAAFGLVAGMVLAWLCVVILRQPFRRRKPALRSAPA